MSRRDSSGPLPDPVCDASATDAVLAIAIGRWDEAALAEAYRRHAGALYALAVRMLGEGPGADELVQEVYLGLWNAPQLFDPDRVSLRGYLLRQCHIRAVEKTRGDWPRAGREDGTGDDGAPGARGPDLELIDLTATERVDQAMAALPEIQRESIRLAYFGGNTYGEVAELLGQPAEAVKSEILLGLQTLRNVLGDGRDL